MRHDPGSDHPEAPARLRVVLERLRADPAVRVVDAAPAPEPALLAVHPERYLRLLEEMSARGGGTLFLDTMMNAASWSAALGAAGAVLAGAEHGHAGRGHAFAAIRPPGHHALASKGMGFCLLANAVIAARHAQRLGRERILIIDWDVHHGNGTQALVEADATIRYVSLHQWPWYPGTGAAADRGPHKNVWNVPMRAALPPETYVGVLLQAVDDATRGFVPDLVLVSAGFDSLRGDPLGGFTLGPEHIAQLTTELVTRAATWCGGRIVSALEGGYAPERLGQACVAHMRALAEMATFGA